MYQFDEFRQALSRKINDKVNYYHIYACKDALVDVGFEGSEVGYVGGITIFEAYEGYAYGQERTVEPEPHQYANDFDGWYEEEGQGILRDWMLDMHHGVCDEYTVKKIDASLGLSD